MSSYTEFKDGTMTVYSADPKLLEVTRANITDEPITEEQIIRLACVPRVQIGNMDIKDGERTWLLK